MRKALLALLFIFLLTGCTVQSPAEYYGAAMPSSSASVTVSVRCDTILQNIEKLDPALLEGGYVPSDGFLLPPTACPLLPGDTAYSVLERALKGAQIPLETRHSTKYGNAYVEGIGYIYEFSCGRESGWMYLVNGHVPGYGSSQFTLSDGDTVEWVYTCALGRDIEKGEPL